MEPEAAQERVKASPSVRASLAALNAGVDAARTI
jgi:hypothetical protein